MRCLEMVTTDIHDALGFALACFENGVKTKIDCDDQNVFHVRMDLNALDDAKAEQEIDNKKEKDLEDMLLKLLISSLEEK